MALNSMRFVKVIEGSERHVLFTVAAKAAGLARPVTIFQDTPPEVEITLLDHSTGASARQLADKLDASLDCKVILLTSRAAG